MPRGGCWGPWLGSEHPPPGPFWTFFKKIFQKTTVQLLSRCTIFSFCSRLSSHAPCNFLNVFIPLWECWRSSPYFPLPHYLPLPYFTSDPYFLPLFPSHISLALLYIFPPHYFPPPFPSPHLNSIPPFSLSPTLLPLLSFSLFFSSPPCHWIG